MVERRLGPVVGLGTYATFRDDRERARAVVGASLDAGCRVMDTSPMYGAAEGSLADALGGRRDEAIVATKIWTPDPGDARAQLDAQIGRFGRVDLEQVHNLVAWREHLPWLEAERDEGRIGRLGVTHYDPGAFAELERALLTRRFDVVQLPLNPRERECERRLLPLAAELGVAVLVMRPFGGTGAPLLAREPREAALEPLREAGVATWGQALLAWILADERVDAVIPATSKPERVRENAQAAAVRLSPELRELVGRLAA